MRSPVEVACILFRQLISATCSVVLILFLGGCARSHVGQATSSVFVHDAPVSQGTADGSGAGLRKSTVEQINKVLFDTEEAHLNIKRRLRLLFHRLAFMRARRNNQEFRKNIPLIINDVRVQTYLTNYSGNPAEPDPAAFAVLDKIFAGAASLDQDIEALVIKPQDKRCMSTDGRESLMAIREITPFALAETSLVIQLQKTY